MLFHFPYKIAVSFGLEDMLQLFLKCVPDVFFRKIGAGCDLPVHCDEDAAIDDQTRVGMSSGKVQFYFEGPGDFSYHFEKGFFILQRKTFRL